MKQKGGLPRKAWNSWPEPVDVQGEQMGNKWGFLLTGGEDALWKGN